MDLEERRAECPDATTEALRAAYEAAKLVAKTDRSLVARAAMIAAWDALDKASPAPHGRAGFASRAGVRQARERRQR